MKPELIVNGAAGRMGRRVLALAIEDGQFNIAAAVDSNDHPDIGKDAGLLAGTDTIGIKLDSRCPAGAAVMIDFSLPQTADNTIDYCEKNNTALVMATTGLTDTQTAKLEKLSRSVPVVHASNFSVGMNTLFDLVGKVAKMLGSEYDIEIVEAHHRFKKDSPSGTALTLAENIAKQTGRDYPNCLTHGREGKDALRQKDTIGMHAVRAGDIIGDHSVIFAALGETITLSHSAHSRDIFARGALRAAKWLTQKPPAMYSMKDILTPE